VKERLDFSGVAIAPPYFPTRKPGLFITEEKNVEFSPFFYLAAAAYYYHGLPQKCEAEEQNEGAKLTSIFV